MFYAFSFISFFFFFLASWMNRLSDATIVVKASLKTLAWHKQPCQLERIICNIKVSQSSTLWGWAPNLTNPFYCWATWIFSIHCCFLSLAALRRSFPVRRVSSTNNTVRKMSAEAGRLFVDFRRKLASQFFPSSCRWCTASAFCLIRSDFHIYYAFFLFVCFTCIFKYLCVRRPAGCNHYQWEALLWTNRGTLLSFRENISC